MNELIKVDFSGERPAVSARELHEFLGVETRFNDWFSRMCEYGFLEGEDFYSFLSKTPTGGRPAQDAALSIDMAKEICMLQRNEKGKLARQYFLALERDWNSPERVMARALEIAHKKLRCLEEQRELDRPKVLFANAVAAARTSILVGELAKVLKQNGVDMGQNRLFTWLRENGYLIRRNGNDYNMPTQKAMEMGLFEIKETVVAHADGHTDTKKTLHIILTAYNPLHISGVSLNNLVQLVLLIFIISKHTLKKSVRQSSNHIIFIDFPDKHIQFVNSLLISFNAVFYSFRNSNIFHRRFFLQRIDKLLLIQRNIMASLLYGFQNDAFKCFC